MAIVGWIADLDDFPHSASCVCAAPELFRTDSQEKRITDTRGERSFGMASNQKIRVAIVGLGFGAEFIPIYQAHPAAEMYGICRRNKKELDACGDKFGIKVRYTD